MSGRTEIKDMPLLSARRCLPSPKTPTTADGRRFFSPEISAPNSEGRGTLEG
jgi:hypothetical protein